MEVPERAKASGRSARAALMATQRPESGSSRSSFTPARTNRSRRKTDDPSCFYGTCFPGGDRRRPGREWAVPPPPAGLLAADKAGFDLLLIAHVAAALVGFGSLVTSGIQAARLRRAGPSRAGPTLRQYFAP